MSKLNQLFNAEKILYVIKRIRNGGCNESLSEYTVVPGVGDLYSLLPCTNLKCQGHRTDNSIIKQESYYLPGIRGSRKTSCDGLANDSSNKKYNTNYQVWPERRIVSGVGNEP